MPILKNPMDRSLCECTPAMPSDFWPEQVIITVKHLGFELSCPVPYADKTKVSEVLYGLRLAVFQASNWTDDTGYATANDIHVLLESRVGLGYKITQKALADNFAALVYRDRQAYDATREAWTCNLLNPDGIKNNAPQTFLARLKAYRSRIHDAWLVLTGRAEIDV